MAPSSGEQDGYVDLRKLHEKEINELRMRMEPILKKYPRYDTDFALLRWLRGQNFDIDLAAERMKRALETLDAIGTFDKDLSSEAKIYETVTSVTPVAEYFPGGNLGYEKNGNVILMHDVGKARPRSLVSAGRVSEFYVAALYDCEGTQTLIRFEEAKRNRKLGAIVIVDLSDFSFDVLFHIPATKIYMNVLTMLQEIFPDTAMKLYLVNAPLAVHVLLQMVKMILAKETLEVFELLGSDWKEVLVERHGADCLPKSCGGTKGNDFLRKGGNVPDEVKQQIKTMYIAPEKLTKITVNARQATRIPVEVKTKNSKLSWYFTCTGGDIAFSVVFQDREVWPCFKISTEFSPEFGEIQCKECGTYELVFSNKHGRFWNKQLMYSVDVTEFE